MKKVKSLLLIFTLLLVLPVMVNAATGDYTWEFKKIFDSSFSEYSFSPNDMVKDIKELDDGSTIVAGTVVKNSTSSIFFIVADKDKNVVTKKIYDGYEPDNQSVFEIFIDNKDQFTVVIKQSQVTYIKKIKVSDGSTISSETIDGIVNDITRINNVIYASIDKKLIRIDENGNKTTLNLAEHEDIIPDINVSNNHFNVEIENNQFLIYTATAISSENNNYNFYTVPINWTSARDIKRMHGLSYAFNLLRKNDDVSGDELNYSFYEYLPLSQDGAIIFYEKNYQVIQNGSTVFKADRMVAKINSDSGIEKEIKLPYPSVYHNVLSDNKLVICDKNNETKLVTCNLYDTDLNVLEHMYHII